MYAIRSLAFIVGSCLLCFGSAHADVLTVDPDTGQLSNGGAFATSVDWRGVQIADGGISAVDGAREYLVYGDFNVNLGDTVTAPLGSTLGVRFIVGNNATLAGTFDFTASGMQGRGGGGGGGSGGLGGTGGQAGIGGVGGNDPDNYIPGGGAAGAGGSWKVLGEEAWDGGYGWGNHDGADGTAGAAGTHGQVGGNGDAGFNHNVPTIAQGRSNRGTGGSKGVIGDTPYYVEGGDGGLGGPGWGSGGLGGKRGIGGHAGDNGGNGGHANDGSYGLNGISGTNDLTPILSGGAGGTGGQGGGGGGGSGAGAGGDSGSPGGGGGGGGGGSGNNFVWPFGAGGDDGGNGGAGGKSGDGGRGGNGNRGGDGSAAGNGGAGGGAVEVKVLGQLNLSGPSFQAKGGVPTNSLVNGQAGGWGDYGDPGTDGTAGQTGSAGLFDTRVTSEGAAPGTGGAKGLGATLTTNATTGTSGTNAADGTGHSSYGGTGGGGAGGGGGGGGGHGGRGGYSGSGSYGGYGEDGAGGTVILSATSLTGDATVNTRRGLDYIYTVKLAAHDGKFVLGRNTVDVLTGTVSSGLEFTLTDPSGYNLGPREVNPFIAGLAIATPYIPGLIDGADVCGLTGLSAEDAQLAGLFGDAPADATAAMHLMDEGPAGLGQDWHGFDMLLLVNLTEDTLHLPQLGIGTEGHLTDLVQGGWARSTQFGGTGYEVMTELPGLGVYAMLVPEGIGEFNLDAAGYVKAWSATMAFGDSLYLAALTGDLNGDGFVGITDLNLVLGNWNQNVPPGDPLADPSGDGFIGIEDLNTVLGNWNAGTPPVDSAVPEPSTVMLLLHCGAWSLSRQRDRRGMG